jgi:hypothetical protein
MKWRKLRNKPNTVFTKQRHIQKMSVMKCRQLMNLVQCLSLKAKKVKQILTYHETSVFITKFHTAQSWARVIQSTIQGAIRKFLGCYCCNCLGIRKWERRPGSHLKKPSASVCHVTPCCEHVLFLHKAFRLRVSFCLRWMTKLSNVSASSFAWSSVNPLPKPLKCFVRFFGEHSLSRAAVFEWHSRFKTSRVSDDDDEYSGQPSTIKTT